MNSSPVKGLRAPHVGELVAELAPIVCGRTLKDLAPLPPRDLLLVLEGDPPPRLRLSADGDLPRLHLVRERTRRHKGPLGPFFRTLLEELEGARLRTLEQVRGDRIVLLEFDRTRGGGRRALVLELTGRHANLILLDPGERVLAVLVPPPRGAASAARLTPGELWVPPPGNPPRGEVPPLVEWLDPPHPLPEGPFDAPLSARVESALGGAARELRRRRLGKDLSDRLRRRVQRARARVKGLAERRRAASESEAVRRDAELLKAALGQVKRGMESIELPDWFEEGAPPRRIALDPKRSPKANLERLFARAKKLERSAETVVEELALAENRLEILEGFHRRSLAADVDPEALEREAREAGVLEERQASDVRRRRPAAPRLPYRRFEVSDGIEVRVGRGAADNDALTFRHSRGGDLWLHTADCPGSHVILRLPRGAEAPKEALLDAAHLAVHFSPARGRERVPVHVAHRKEVHKPRGAKAGLVTLSGGKILEVRMQQERLERLLRQGRPSPGTGGRGEGPA